MNGLPSGPDGCCEVVVNVIPVVDPDGIAVTVAPDTAPAWFWLVTSPYNVPMLLVRLNGTLTVAPRAKVVAAVVWLV